MSEPVCVKCGAFAARDCTLCGNLCVEHTCEHLAHSVPVIHELSDDESGVSGGDVQVSPHDRVIVEDRPNTTNWLSDEVMIGMMSDQQLEEAKDRYRNVLRSIELELRRREDPNSGIVRRKRGFSAPRLVDALRGTHGAPQPKAQARKSPAQPSKAAQERELKRRCAALVNSIAYGLIDKQAVAQALDKAKQANKRTEEK